MSIKEIDNLKELRKKANHSNIVEIRKVISTYDNVGNIFLGGIPMIADDMMSFIKNDIIVFGLGSLVFGRGSLVLGLGSSVSGFGSLVFGLGLWSLVVGLWSWVAGLWPKC